MSMLRSIRSRLELRAGKQEVSCLKKKSTLNPEIWINSVKRGRTGRIDWEARLPGILDTRNELYRKQNMKEHPPNAQRPSS